MKNSYKTKDDMIFEVMREISGISKWQARVGLWLVKLVSRKTPKAEMNNFYYDETGELLGIDNEQLGRVDKVVTDLKE